MPNQEAGWEEANEEEDWKNSGRTYTSSEVSALYKKDQVDRWRRMKATHKLLGLRPHRWEMSNGDVVRLITLDELEALQREVPRSKVWDILNEEQVMVEMADEKRQVGGWVAYGYLEVRR